MTELRKKTRHSIRHSPVPSPRFTNWRFYRYTSQALSRFWVVFGFQRCRLIGKGHLGLGMCDMTFPSLVESCGWLGLVNRLTGQLISGPCGLFEQRGGGTWGGNRVRLHSCVLHRGTSSPTSPVDATWLPSPHTAMASRDPANVRCELAQNTQRMKTHGVTYAHTASS